ncbi:hypothetical protein CR513_41319, partial [Mucuna pruriens]
MKHRLAIDCLYVFIVLENSVLSSLPLFYLLFLKMQNKVLNNLIRLQRTFLWVEKMVLLKLLGLDGIKFVDRRDVWVGNDNLKHLFPCLYQVSLNKEAYIVEIGE